MLTSKIKQENISILQKTAIELYKEGKTVREVGDILNRSHTWVWMVVRDKTKKKTKRYTKTTIINNEIKFKQFNASSLRRYNGEIIKFEDWKEYTKDWPLMCFCCGWKDPHDGFVIDHIKSASMGGKHELDNLQILCLKCNSRKGNKNWDFRGNLRIFVPVYKDLTETN